MSPRTIHPAPTSVAGFLGTTPKGPTDRPGVVTSLSDFAARYGAPTRQHPLTQAVALFFGNGGREAGIGRIDPDGRPLDEAHLIGPELQARRSGLWMFDRLDACNVLCIPPFDADRDVSPATWQAAAAYASVRGAVLLVDPPRAWHTWGDADDDAIAALVPDGPLRSSCALYVPWLRLTGPGVDPGAWLPASGAVAGLYARTDAEHGVWIAPAGPEARLEGVDGVAPFGAGEGLGPGRDEGDPGTRHPGVNAIRMLAGQPGPVVWGARTLAGDHTASAAWKYVSVRRLALFVEQTLQRSLAWAVFESNDARLWTAVSSLGTTFLDDLFRRGALRGTTSRDAFFVRCDRTTMSDDDIARGHLVVEVGIAPLRPAEFIVLRIGVRARRAEP